MNKHPLATDQASSMKTHNPTFPPGHSVARVIAALLSVGVTSWIRVRCGLNAEAAVALYVLIGLPTYTACVRGYDWFRTSRQPRPH